MRTVWNKIPKWIAITIVMICAMFIWKVINPSSASWRYKMIVTVETPEGLVQGSAVRQMGNDTAGSFIPEVGNPADVRGEAVVVDMGKRGALFALISSDSDMEFYSAFPIPGEAPHNGGSTPEGIRYYASLPEGTTGILVPTEFPGYPKLVTFTDMNDPKSVTLAQVWIREDSGKYALQEDRMEKLFGKGVRLKDITLEITKEPATWGIVDRYLSSNFWEAYRRWVKSMDIYERAKLIPINLFTFKQGETK